MSVRVVAIGDTDHIAYLFAALTEWDALELVAAAPGGAGDTLDAFAWHAAECGRAWTRYDDYRVMLDRERADLVVVAPALALQSAIACACLARGLAVMIEKPMALTVADLVLVRAAHEAARRPLGMMLAGRYEPAFHTAQRLVREGAIGEPTGGSAQKSFKRGRRPDWFRRRCTFGGIWAWVGIDVIDGCRYVSGHEVAGVRTWTSKLHAPDYPEMEDTAAGVLAFDNGATMTVQVDFLRPVGAATHSAVGLRLAGERGELEVLGPDALRLTDAAGSRLVAVQRPSLGLVADFARSVVDPSHRCLLSSADALRATELALWARAAADEAAASLHGGGDDGDGRTAEEARRQ
jgi:predicted dehydrogenase